MKIVYTSKQILEDKLPVLFVAHDRDGDWQFLSGQEQGTEDGRVASLEELFAMDETLTELSVMEMGTEARRSNADALWLLYKSED